MSYELAKLAALLPIDGQMDQARWTGTGTVRKSTARHEGRSASAGTGTGIVPCRGHDSRP